MDKIAVVRKWLVVTCDSSFIFKLQILNDIINNTAHSIFVGYAHLNIRVLRKVSTEKILKFIYSVFSEYLTK